MRRSRHWRERAENSISAMLSHEPCLGGVVKFELVAQLTGRVGGQMLVKSAVTVGAVMVLHELDFRRVGVVGLHEPVHELGVIGLGLGARDLQMPLARVDIIGQ